MRNARPSRTWHDSTVVGDPELLARLNKTRKPHPRWRTQQYDSSSAHSIGAVGCAMTSLAMALNSALAEAGRGDEFDPGSMNAWPPASRGNWLRFAWRPPEKPISNPTNPVAGFRSARAGYCRFGHSGGLPGRNHWQSGCVPFDQARKNKSAGMKHRAPRSDRSRHSGNAQSGHAGRNANQTGRFQAPR